MRIPRKLKKKYKKMGIWSAYSEAFDYARLDPPDVSCNIQTISIEEAVELFGLSEEEIKSIKEEYDRYNSPRGFSYFPVV